MHHNFIRDFIYNANKILLNVCRFFYSISHLYATNPQLFFGYFIVVIKWATAFKK